MKVIAKGENGMCMIQAKESEVRSILAAVNGKRPNKVEVGQKIPAIDYAASIAAAKSLHHSTEFTLLRRQVSSLNEHFEELSGAVEKAASIETQEG